MKYLLIAIIIVVIILLLFGIYSALVVASRADNDEKDVEIVIDDANRCVCCGEIIPEGRQVCPNCENEVRK